MADLPYAATSALLGGIASYAGFQVSLADSGARMVESSTLTFVGPGSTPNGLASVWELDGDTWVEVASLDPADQVTAYGFFGWSACLSGDGDTAVVTAPTDGALSSGAALSHTAGQWGSVFVFARDEGGGWTQQGGRLGPAPTNTGDVGTFGYAAALAPDGATLAVSFKHVTGVTDDGGIFIYVRDPDTLEWDEQAFLDDDVDPGVGCPVAFADADTLLVGYPGDEQAHVWTRSGGVWSDTGTLSSPSADADGFGVFVAISRNGLYAVVGAENPSSEGSQVPGTFVFSRASTADSFDYMALLDTPDWGIAPFASIWNTLAVTDVGTVLIGPSPVSFDFPGLQTQQDTSVFVYYRDGADWVPYSDAAPLVAEDAGAGADFGSSVSITPSGSRFAVGGISRELHVGAFWIYSSTAGGGAVDFARVRWRVA